MKNDNSRSVSRISSLLKCFTQGEPELSVSEISRKIELPKSTVHRTLSALSKGEFTLLVGKEPSRIQPPKQMILPNEWIK